ncbi:hypothetical protein [Methanobacterium sp. CWC-01]|uniref:hypothetical protein n=1 Tax=Methanobacterium aridiramus TaxID=2584467 RepID=UPI0025754DEB|nr:hypothetical protein [Methanobacterium sp. CWC-01]
MKNDFWVVIKASSYFIEVKLIRVDKMAKVKGTKKRTRANHKKPGNKRGRGVKH